MLIMPTRGSYGCLRARSPAVCLCLSTNVRNVWWCETRSLPSQLELVQLLRVAETYDPHPHGWMTGEHNMAVRTSNTVQGPSGSGQTAHSLGRSPVRS